ncbi:tripartite tricarboxylate transporter substrate binding protein [Ramlibacter tataouinensis]|uniref:Bug family tripartite tricarboxylate transporter substrate binding protein n=1 Tax=Ramlibacter tataouinensis TaxID=94132 RepID=UPI0022F3D2E6|nr:tripartite tricarboxylate transporter substrate binding protein [Ramlibacter tataouinensis]WBY01337.1 tripartite tricarboxylate transporter substrate binding protein [Ramlibacter tataouinensis]
MAFAAAASTPSHASDAYPSKPIRIVSPHTAGSTTETFGRMLTTEMSELLGQQIIVDAKGGAAGTTGAREVALSKPDGYTGLMNASIQVMYTGMFKSLSFDPIKDFTPVGVFGFAPMVVLVNSESKISSFGDMINRARANPGKLSFASGGLGSLPHLVGELVNLSTSTKMSHVPYNGTGQALTDVAGGHVDVLYASVASALPLVKSGKVRALAVTSARRIDLLPDVPTVAESGIPGFDVTSWYAMWVPKNTPRDIVAKLNKAMRDASNQPAVQQRMKSNGVIASKLTADEFAKFTASENAKWLDVMRRANVEPN